jgi:hypothetical protein
LSTPSPYNAGVPPLGDHDRRSGRHAGGHGQSRHTASQPWTRAACGGLFIGISLTLSTLLSRLLFHRDFLGSYGFEGFVTDVLSGVLAIVGLALIASFTAPIWKWACRRFGRQSGQAAGG